MDVCDRLQVFCVIIDPVAIHADLPDKGDIEEILTAMDTPEFIRRLEEEIHKAVELRRQQENPDDMSAHDDMMTTDLRLLSLPEEGSEGRDNNDDSRENIVIQTGKPKAKEKPPLPSQSVMARNLAVDLPHLRFLDEQSHWRFYKDGWWQSASEEYVYSLVTEAIEAAGIEDFAASYPAGVARLLMSKCIVRQWPDRSSELLPFKNGVLNLTTRELLPHSPQYGFTSIIDREHNPRATDWKPIQDWLNFALDGNQDQVHLLLCWYAAVLRGLHKLHRFLLLVGQGGTGKSTAMQLAQALIGKASSHALTLEALHTNSFQTGNIYDKLLVCISDADKYRGSIGIFKNITGGDAISCEAKFAKAFNCVYKGLVVVTANNPVFTNDDSGLDRRMIMMQFNRVATRVDINFVETLLPSLSAFTNYLLSIPLDTVIQTLVLKEDLSGERLKVEIENLINTNAIATWLNEKCVFDPESFERLGNDKANEEQLFGNYYQHTLKAGQSPRGVHNFKEELLRLGGVYLREDKLTCGRVIYGIRLDDRGEFIETIKSQSQKPVNLKDSDPSSLSSLSS